MNLTSGAIYRGVVTHRRTGRWKYVLRHKIFFLLVDLDDLEAGRRHSQFLGLNRARPLSIHESDYGDRGPQGSLRTWIVRRIRNAGITDPIDSIFVLTLPRVLGYQFNPISLFFALGADDGVRAVVAEVRNTFGGRTSYVVPGGERAAQSLTGTADKLLHVSPFFQIEGDYRFRIAGMDDRLQLLVDYRSGQGDGLLATLALKRYPMTSMGLAGLLVGYPLQSIRVIANIHFHALKLWLKGVPFYGANGRKSVRSQVSGSSKS